MLKTSCRAKVFVEVIFLYHVQYIGKFKYALFYLEPPSFVKKIENTTAVLGSAVKLQGSLKGSAPIAVQWFKDSEILRNDDPNATTSFENNTVILAIANVAINHGGKYTCQAENEAGKQKCDANISVQG